MAYVPTEDGETRITAEEHGVDSDSGQNMAEDGITEEEIVVKDGVATSRFVRQATKKSDAADHGPCNSCGAPLSAIRINVDGRTLLMESCDGCDTRRWQLAGERIDLQEALNQVGEHAGRRRSDA